MERTDFTTKVSIMFIDGGWHVGSKGLSTEVATAFSTDSVRSVVIEMLSRHCAAVSVIDEHLRLIALVALREVKLPSSSILGIIYMAMFIAAISRKWRKDTRTSFGKIELIMSKIPLTVSTNSCILEAASFMGRKQFRLIPVAENGKLLGMISIGAINRGLFFQRGFLA